VILEQDLMATIVVVALLTELQNMNDHNLLDMCRALQTTPIIAHLVYNLLQNTLTLI
jgi:hypothetical protein